MRIPGTKLRMPVSWYHNVIKRRSALFHWRAGMLSLALVLGLGLSLRTKSQSLVLALALKVWSYCIDIYCNQLCWQDNIPGWLYGLRFNWLLSHFDFASTLVPSTQWRLHYQHSVSSFFMSNNCSAMFCVRRRRPHLWNVCFRRAAFWCVQTEQECRMLFWKRLSFWSATSHIFKSLAACYVLLQLTCHQDGLITVKIVAIWSLQIITETVNKKSVRTESGE